MRPKLWLTLVTISLIAASCPAQPDAPDVADVAGPQAWIDAPLDESEIPLAPYEVVAHASSPNGLASFEFSVNGGVVAPAIASAGQVEQTLAYFTYMWTPPAPGTYLLSVRAADSAGNYGPSAEAFVTVGGEVARQVTATEPTPREGGPSPTPTDTPSATPTDTPAPRALPPDTPTPTASITPTPTSTPTDTPTPRPPPPGGSITADSPRIQAGECTVVRWQTENAKEIYLNGEGIAGPIDRTVCPTSTTTYTLRVVGFDNSIFEASVTVEVLPAPPTATFTPIPAQCADGIDNDGDGLVDFIGGDRDCSGPNDDSEAVP